MVNPRSLRPFIDRPIPEKQQVGKLLAPTRQDATAVWLGEEGPGKGRVMLDADSGLEQVADVESAPFPPVGSVVPVSLDSAGRVTRIYAPTVQDLSEATPVGDVAERLMGAATSQYVDEQLGPAREQLDEMRDQLNDPKTGLAATQGKADEAAAVGEAAKAEALAAVEEARRKSQIVISEVSLPPGPGGWGAALTGNELVWIEVEEVSE